MSSNGYYPEERAIWIARNLNNVSLSLDGYEEVQNAQRPARGGTPSFEVVCRSADIFMKSQGSTFGFGLRSTITDLSVEHLPRIVGFFQERFPGVQARLEPVAECGRCGRSRFHTPDPYLFARKFVEASDIFPDARLSYSGFSGIGGFRRKFCGASEPQFAVLPSGLVTACFGYSLEEISLNEFIYGRFDHKTRAFIFDEDRRSWLRGINTINADKCNNCFVKYHCGSDCPALKIAEEKHGVSMLDSKRCIINRELAKWSLEREVRSHATAIDGGAEHCRGAVRRHADVC